MLSLPWKLTSIIYCTEFNPYAHALQLIAECFLTLRLFYIDG